MFDILDAVCANLAREFGEDAAIYTGPVPQGFSVPCFFAEAQPPEISRFLGSRYLYKYRVSVRFFPAPSADSSDVPERLYYALEFIAPPSGLLHAVETSAEDSGGEIRFTAEYNAFFYRQDIPELMGDITIRESAALRD